MLNEVWNGGADAGYCCIETESNAAVKAGSSSCAMSSSERATPDMQ